MHRNTATKWILLLPASIWVLAFTIAPFFYGIWISLNNYFGAEPEFVGFQNYIRFFQDEDALHSLWITVIFVAAGVTSQIILGLLLAGLFNRSMPMRRTLRTIVTMPLFATPIAVGFLYYTIFNEESGLVNGSLGLKIPWLSNAHWELVSVMIVDLWQWTPFCVLICLAALQGIPSDYYEATLLETKHRWTVFWHITFPVLQPTIVLVLLLRVTEAFKVFDIPFTLTQGGPGSATQVLSMFAYEQGFRFLNFGYGAANSLIIFVIVMVIVTFLFKRIRQAYQ